MARFSGPRSATAMRCLLDLDPELSGGVDPASRRAARAAATAIVIEADPGRLPLESWLRFAAGGPGVLVLSGVLALSVTTAGRTSVELLGTGDLLQPCAAEAEALLSCETSWRALVPMRLALLDRAFTRRTRFWPEIGQALLERVGIRLVNLNIQRAIAAQPRLEVRLALLLWHLASRWGQTERDGIRLSVPLTHQMLGHLVGAERPSISHALARLADSGMVTGHGDEWHLRSRIADHLPAMIPPADAAEMIVASLATSRVS